MSVQPTRVVGVRPVTDVQARRVDWLWEHLIPIGKLTVLAGRPGLGKSQLTMLLASYASVGLLEGSLRGTPSNVLLVSGEDDPEDTIKPRLIAAGADQARVYISDVRETDEHGQPTPGEITLPSDTAAIAQVVKEHRIKLVVFDPIVGFLDGRHNAYNNQEVRRALAPLARLAETHRCAVVAVMHLNKSNATDPLARIADSGAFTALARSVLVFGTDPDDPEGDEGPGRVLAVAKSNLAGPGNHSQRLVVEQRLVEDINRDEFWAPRLVLKGPSDAMAEDLLSTTEDRGAKAEARDFLRDELAGGMRPATEIKEAAGATGIALATLKRAKFGLVKSTRPGGKGPWFWQLESKAIDAKSNGHAHDRDDADLQALVESFPQAGETP